MSGVVVADLVFVLGGASVAARGVQPSPVEEHFDVVEHRPARVPTRRERLAVDALEFPRREEALRDRVESQHCRGRDSDWIMLLSVSRSVNSAEVYWAAAVGVERRARRWPAGLDRHT